MGVDTLPREDRLGFIRKVYATLGAQLLVTVLIGYAVATSQAMLNLVTANLFVYLLFALILPIGLLIALYFNRKNHPLNLVLALAFTVAEAIMMGVISSFYETSIVLMAAALTMLVFFTLSAIAWFSKVDFSFMGPFLFSLLIIVILGNILSLFIPMGSTINLWLSILGAVVFSGYILYDTSNIMRCNDVDEWLIGAIDLYLDIINLFVNLLSILSYFSSD